MLQGYTLPLTPGGLSGLVPSPPWHFAGDMLVVEFWADPHAVAALLPAGLTPHEDKGRMTAIFADWQSCTDDRSELVDPTRSQYHEFLVTIGARLGDREVAYCPHIWVDQDYSMVRGWVQGYPKKLGSVGMTRTFDVGGIASPGLKEGARFCGVASTHGCRLASAAITLDCPTDTLTPHFTVPTVGVRHFPRLTAGRQDDPAVHELVGMVTFDRDRSVIWEGGATLEFPEVPGEELSNLAPVRVGRGYRFSYSYSVNDLKELKQL